MYDIRDDLLVFVSQTHHPILEHHTGYIFAEYKATYRKPRELFFTHFWEVNVYALHTGAKIELNPENKPGIVTALDYVLSAQDDSLYGATGAHWGEGTDTAAARRHRRQQGTPKEVEAPETDVQAWADEVAGLGSEFGDPVTDGDVGDIDFFGE